MLALALGLAAVTCGDDSTEGESNGMDGSGSESTATSSTTSTSSTGSTQASEGSTDAPTSTSASTGMATTSGGSTSGTMGPCGECADGETCRLAACCDDVGYCVADKAPSCGGFIGKVCPEPLVCLLDFCVGDGDGRCVDAERATALQNEYPGCWNDPG